jgi:hypothetical protein
MAGKLIAALQVALGLESAKFVQEIDRAKAKTREMKVSVDVLGTAMGALRSPMLLAAAAAGAFATSFFKAADAVNDFAEGSGLAIEEVLALQSAMVQSGKEADNAAQMWDRFSVTLGAAADGQKEQADLFKELGVSIADAGGLLRPEIDIFRDLTSVLSGMSAGAERARLQVQLFGKQFGNLDISKIDQLSRNTDKFSGEAKKGVLAIGEIGDAIDQMTEKAKIGFLTLMGKARDAYTGIKKFLGFGEEEPAVPAPVVGVTQGGRQSGTRVKPVKSTGGVNPVTSYLESLDSQIRKLKEGEDAALRFEAAKQGGAAGLAKMEEIIKLRREEAELQEDLRRQTQEANEEIRAQSDLRRFAQEQIIKNYEDQIALAKKQQEIEMEGKWLLLDASAQAEIAAQKELDAMDLTKKAADDQLDVLEDIRDGFKSIGSTIVEAFMSGKSAAQAFKSALSSLLQKLASRSLDKFLDTIFKSDIKGAPSLFENFMSNVPVLGSIFGKRAGGGPVNSGAPYLVGERGPELFVPSMAGQVVPSYAMSGTSTVNNYNIQAIDVKSFEERIMGSNRAVWAANSYAQKSLSPRGRA